MKNAIQVKERKKESKSTFKQVPSAVAAELKNRSSSFHKLHCSECLQQESNLADLEEWVSVLAGRLDGRFLDVGFSLLRFFIIILS